MIFVEHCRRVFGGGRRVEVVFLLSRRVLFLFPWCVNLTVPYLFTFLLACSLSSCSLSGLVDQCVLPDNFPLLLLLVAPMPSSNSFSVYLSYVRG